MNDRLVAVGMSGGVDSSVAALLLKEQGYRVIGLFMKNWEEEQEGVCSAAVDYDDVRAVCAHIGIPCYALNFSRQYWDNVFEHFLNELKAGRTPNPDILCNREIKFKVLMEKARSLGADYLATGHYARTAYTAGKGWQLLKGIDANKDQTYFLYTLTGDLLANVLFPIGHLPKSEVRALARRHNLATSEKKDSVGICFIGKRNFKDFVSRYIAYHPGDMVTETGKVVGRHSGVAYYTHGQRHGLGIGGEGEAWFVAGKRIDTNELVVVQGSEHPALFRSELIASDLCWVQPDQVPSQPWRCSAKVRYRQEDQPCTVTPQGENVCVVFDAPQRAVTPGQAIVFYDGERCLGGGTIQTL